MPAVGLLLAPDPVPEGDASYFASIERARERFAELGARLELVAGALEHPASTLVLTDGFGEIYASWTSEDRLSWPEASELVEWLEFIGSQCPKCSPAEPRWLETR